jgi:hypothetical protein
MKSVLAELIKDYDGMYDKEYDVDLERIIHLLIIYLMNLETM